MEFERKSDIIVQVLDVPLVNITERFEYFSKIGITHVQISPVQTHCIHVKPWYRVYQPVGTKIGNSLGSESEIQNFFQTAHRFELKIIVDVVFHHTSACPLCNSFFSSLRWLKNQMQIFYYRKFIGINQSNRFNCLDWGPKEDVSSNTVFLKHKKFLEKLIEMGAEGFRFDAAKHIPPEYLIKLYNESGAREKGILCYGEVMDGDPNICKEYIRDGFHVSNFPLTFTLISSFGWNGDIRNIMNPYFHELNGAISIADCHDSKLGNSYKFADEHDGILAIASLLAMGKGIPLIYYTQIKENRVQQAIKFNHLMYGTDCYCLSMSNPNVLFLQRGDRGLAIVNKGGDFFRTNLIVPGIQCGKYKELVFQFDVEFTFGEDGNPSVRKWGSEQEKECVIGPREILLLVKF